ncbi:RNA polymerase subunit sigma-70 [Streptomyces sp. NPDC057623]|uniref:RNA polymerase subunit sigma-70 n=1 Tax=Streptomyces sp. NPDC057623 TaxID=3346187 RepID=UPI0036C48D0F
MAARAGDEDALRVLVGPYLRELHVRCYRMLGSVQDATEDVMQEVLLRAWRHLDAFQGRSSVCGWLYRIATNRCLTARIRAEMLPLAQPQDVPPSNADDVEVSALEPCPDELLAPLDDRHDPSARYELRESVQLAFLAALQLLPARQRAVLLLRDVLGFSAAETSGLLDTSVAAVNSALQRARATLQQAQMQDGERPADDHPPLGSGASGGPEQQSVQDAGLHKRIRMPGRLSHRPVSGQIQETPDGARPPPAAPQHLQQSVGRRAASVSSHTGTDTAGGPSSYLMCAALTVSGQAGGERERAHRSAHRRPWRRFRSRRDGAGSE